MLFEHYSQVPSKLWRWQSFTPKEIACRGTGEILINQDALDKLQLLRDIIKKPLFINSAYRSALHNARVGGAPRSRHKAGDAFDISLRNHNTEDLHKAALKAGFTGFGIYQTFLHVDTGRIRQW